MAPLVTLEGVLVVILGALVWHADRADAFDRRVAQVLYARPGSTARSLFAAVTVLGSTPVVAIASVSIAIWLARRTRDRIVAGFVPVAVLVAVVIESVTKVIVRRARPTTAALAHVHGQSFPSGHATAAAVLAFSVALVVVALGLRRRRAVVGLLAIYSLMVSGSRLVLGVHYLTDVIAGTALGGAVALVTAWSCTRGDDAAP